MDKKTVRFMLTVPNDMAKRAEGLKKNVFYDKPYAEMYRQLIQLGMDKLQENKKGYFLGLTVGKAEKKEEDNRQTV